MVLLTSNQTNPQQDPEIKPENKPDSKLTESSVENPSQKDSDVKTNVSVRTWTVGQILRGVAPYMAPALVFSSGLFAFFTPVLFVLLGRRGGLLRVLAALFTNGAVLWGLGQQKMIAPFWLFSVFFGMGSILMVDLFLKVNASLRAKSESKKFSPINDSWILVGMTGLWMTVILVGGHLLCSFLYKQGLLATLGQFWTQLSAELPMQVKEEWLGEVSEDEFKAILPYQILSAFVTLGVFTSWMCVQMAQALSPPKNIGQAPIRDRNFRVSDFFLIPGLVAWAWVLFEKDFRAALPANLTVSDAFSRSMGVILHGIGSLYFVQGLIVFGVVLAAFHVPRFFRMLLALGVITLMLPAFSFLGGLDGIIDIRKKLFSKKAFFKKRG